MARKTERLESRGAEVSYCSSRLDDDDEDEVRLSTWVTVEGLDGYQVRFVIRRRGSRSDVVELHISPLSSGRWSGHESVGPVEDPDVGISTGGLRSLTIGALMRVAASGAAEMWIPAVDGPDAKKFERWASGFVAKPRPGRAGRDDIEYARLCARYVAIVRTGARKPLVALKAESEALGEPLSASRLRSLLYEARRRGLLTDAPDGAAGGDLTEKALALLEGDDNGSR